MRGRLRRVLLLLAAVSVSALGTLAGAAGARAALPSVRHVFVIVLENESASTTFGPGSPAPYLSKTLRSQGAYLPNYFGTGHQSNDNYISMISGQAPNVENQADCQNFDDVAPGTIGSYGQAAGEGCIYPSSVPTVASQLSGAGLTWRDYNEDMGNTPSREASECGHPGVNTFDNTQKATAADGYATRHNPFVYFHSIIDDTTLCDTHVVNLDLLQKDLSTAAGTPNYVFITPNLCDDGHDAPCANGAPGGLAQADSFLRTWVPRITGSPAFKKENGLLIITFDESTTSDTSSCCGEIPGPGSPQPGDTGPGGGKVGAVLLSPCIAPGTVSSTPYNHYTMLRSVEDLFGLSHIGYAQLPGETSFGSDVFTRRCAADPPGGTGPPGARVSAPAIASSAAATPTVPVRWSAAGTANRFTVQVQRTSGRSHRWRTLLTRSSRRSLRFRGASGATYRFRVQAINATGAAGPWATASTIIPTGARAAGSSYQGRWRLASVRQAWESHAMVSSTKGSTFTLSYTGGTLALIGDRWPQGGLARVTVGGHSHSVSFHSTQPHARQLVFRAKLGRGHHRLTIQVLRGVVALEGLAISNRTG
jgi:phosphatidylinositol-3-phosphatase